MIPRIKYILWLLGGLFMLVGIYYVLPVTPAENTCFYREGQGWGDMQGRWFGFGYECVYGS